MAELKPKKKIMKTEKKEASVPTQLEEIGDLWRSLQMREKEICGLHQRIDRIVIALGKSKNVKGM